MPLNWLRKLLHRKAKMVPNATVRTTRRLRARLALESLETRIVPTSLASTTLYVANPAAGNAITGGFSGSFAVTNDQGTPGVLDAGDTVTWNPAPVAGSSFTAAVPGLIFGTNAFGTITAAVNAAEDGDTIEVLQGTYAENNAVIAVNHHLTLLGSEYGVDARSGRPGAPETIVDDTSGAFNVTASNVVIDGFTLEGVTNSAFLGYAIAMGNGSSTGTQVINNIIEDNVAGIGLANSGASQVVIQHDFFKDNTDGTENLTNTDIYSDQYVAGTSIGLSNVLIDSNEFTNTSPVENSWAIGISNTGTIPFTNLTISNNDINNHGRGAYFYDTVNSTVTDNTILLAGTHHYALGFFNGDSNFSVTNNRLENGGNDGVEITADFGNPNANITINQNSLANNAVDAIYVDPGSYTGILDARYNYWGTTDPAAVQSMISVVGGSVDFSPFLNNNESVAAQATPGFQADLSSVTATTLGAQIGGANPLQEAIDTASPGGTVEVAAGSYADITLTKTLTLVGAGAGSTFINGGSPALTVSSGTTTLSGMTFTNSADSLPVILVNGSGSLNLTTSTINGSFNNQSLVQANTTGSLDLGDATTIGDDTFNISGGANSTGNAYFDVIASTGFSAVGNMWDTDPTAGTSYIDFTGVKHFADLTTPTLQADALTIANGILDQIDIPGRGYVSFIADTAVVTQASETTTVGAIQRAVNAVTVNGFVLVGAGNFGGGTIVVSQSVTLLGAQHGVDARTRAAVPETIVSNSEGDFQIEADNVTIDGFTLDGVTSDPNVDPGSLGVAIWTNPGFSGTHGGTKIYNNIITGNIAGIELDNDGTFQTNVQFNLFKNNAQAGAGSGTAIETNFGLSSALIDSNTFTNNPNAALVVEAPSQGIVFSNNHADSAVAIFDTASTQFTRNTISNSNSDGIYVGGGDATITISSNVVTGLAATFGAIHIDNPFGVAPNSSVSISNNILNVNGGGGAAVEVTDDGVPNSAYPGTLTLSGDSITTAGSDVAIADEATTPIDATAEKFNTILASSASTAQLFTIQNTIIDGIDVGGFGLVRLKAANVYVTPHSFFAPGTTAPDIQRGINLASPGDTVNVAAGTYPSNLSISENLSVLGAGAGSTVINAAGGVGATLSGAGNTITLQGLSITGGSSAITSSGLTTLNLTDVASNGNTSGGTFTGTTGTVNLTARAGATVSANAFAGTFGTNALQTITYAGSTLNNLHLGTLGNGNLFTVKPATGQATAITVDGGTPFPPGSTLNLDLSAVSSPMVNPTGPGAGFLSTSPAANPLSWVHIGTVTGSPAAPVVITATPGHNYHVFRSGTGNANLEVDDVTALATVFDGAYSFVSMLTINGTGAGANQVNVDFAGATNPIPSGGIFFNGMAGTNNLLKISNGSFVTATSTYTGPHSGSLTFDSLGTVTYTGLQPVDMTGSTAGNLVFNLPNTTVGASLEDDGTTGNGISQLRSTNSTFELTTFSNPTSSLTINSFPGTTNSITVSAAAPPVDFDAALTIAGNSGADTVNVNGGLTLGHAGGNTGNLSITASAININATINNSAGSVGNVTLTAGGAITEGASNAISSNATGLLSTNSAAGTSLTGPNQVSRFTASNSTSSAISLTNTAATLTVTGITQSGAAAGSNVSVNNTGGLTTSGPISTAGTATAGAVNLTVSGTASLNSTVAAGIAAITLTGGTFNLGAANRFSSGTNPVVLVGSTTVALQNFAQQFGSLASSVTGSPLPNQKVVLGSATLTTGNAVNTEFDGVLSGTGGALTKQGSDTFTLGNVNTYTGATTINNGTLTLGVNGALGAGTSVTINNGTVLAMNGNNDTVTAAHLVNGSITGPGTLTGTSLFDVQNGTISASLAGTAALTKSTAATVVLTGAASNTYSGITTISGGTLTLSGSLTGSGGAVNLTGASVTLNGTGSISGTGRGVVVSGSSDVVGASGGGLTINTLGGTGVTVSGATASAKILGNTIQTGSGNNGSGIDVNAGTALIQGNHLEALGLPSTPAAATSYPYYGLRARGGAVVDAGQVAAGGFNFTGQGISTGGNFLGGYQDYSAATDPSTLTYKIAQAILNQNNTGANSRPGPQGAPADLMAQNNTWGALAQTNYVAIELKVYHDNDYIGVGFVNYVTPSTSPGYQPSLQDVRFYSVNDSEAAGQRSVIRRIRYAFDDYVVLPTGAITLATHSGVEGQGTPTIVMTATGTSFDPATGQFRFEFGFASQAGVEPTSGSLMDGQYLLTFNNALIRAGSGSGPSLNAFTYNAGTLPPTFKGTDGVMDGTPNEIKFWRLFGDLDGLGSIDQNDINAMAAALYSLSNQAKYNRDLDFNNDGSIDAPNDLAQFNIRASNGTGVDNFGPSTHKTLKW